MDPKLAAGHVRQEGRDLSRAQERLSEIPETAISVSKRFFAQGKRLRKGDLERLVQRFDDLSREILLPILTLHRVGSVKLNSPKGDEHEMLYAFAVPIREDGTGQMERFSLSTLRIFATRRRLELNMRATGVEVTAHAVRRCLERQAIETTRVSDIFRDLISYVGIVPPIGALVSRQPESRGRIAVPCENGLMMAEMIPRSIDDEAEPQDSASWEGSWSLLCGGQVVRKRNLRDCLHPAPLFSVRTTIGLLELAPPQRDYKHRVEQWTARHANAIWPMSRTLLWPDATLDGCRDPLVALEPERLRAIADLWRIMSRPTMFRAIGNVPEWCRKSDKDEALDQDHKPVLVASEPMPRLQLG